MNTINENVNVWLHRISHRFEYSYPLIKNGYLTIGYSDLSNEDLLKHILKDDYAYFSDKFLSVFPGWERKRRSLWRFVKEFNSGDIVVVPTGSRFSIYKLKGETKLFKDIDLTCISQNIEVKENNKVWIDDESVDLGYVWEVESIAENIERRDVYDSALISRMKIRSTNANINDLKENIKKIINAHKNNKKISIYDTIIQNTIQPLEKILVEKLDDIKFEKLIKWYFQKVGASDVYIPAKNNSNNENGADADILATFENLKLIICVQAKHHVGCTSDWAVKQITEYKSQNEDKDDEYTYIPWIISTADEYSSDAIEAAIQGNVRLINRKEFATMLLDAGISNIDSAFNN